ncbi:lipopolysaccharide biosynthesis protein [Flammeovirga aprica JL-4]|uniref:Lipopolysaccharide biosynthesis protein n=2 Tax=Flammeovirga aprica TaxID=29528 RepID=A0A7X9P1I7_9BACT|nr:lipopolysaccharide biosynthesis protein [Flammeovirga aprica JL-4]
MYALGSIFHFRHKPIKINYFIKNIFGGIILPTALFPSRKDEHLKIDKKEQEYIDARVDYYMKKETNFSTSKQATSVGEFKLDNHGSAYFFDLKSRIKYFNPWLKIDFIFGDVIHIPEVPSIVKSRPISDQNENSILLKLNKIRHFNFVNDWIKFENKKDMLVTRGNVFNNHDNRLLFLEKYFNHPLCDIGKVNFSEANAENYTDNRFIKEKMTIEEQLHYKFIYCWEGNDVATNLKWVMSSNSIAVMPTPTMETWFMEGKLIPDYHYIHVKDDLSDLPEKIEYYSKNTKKALEILKNAHRFVEQFKNDKREKKIELLVLDKYFRASTQ